MRASEVQVTAADRVFYYSRWRAASLALLVMGVGIGCIQFGRSQPAGLTRYLSYYIGAVLLLGLLLLHRNITARFRASNWLAWLTPTGVVVKFRSYLNYSLPDTDEIIVFIPYQEIRSAGLLNERTALTDAAGHRSMQITRYIEIDLSVDVTALATAVATERAKPAPSERHWYGTSSTLYGHYPVRVVAPLFVQVQWSATPGRKAFLDALRPFAQIAPTLCFSQDFTKLVGLTGEQQQQHLRELDAAGQTLLAISTARRLYGYDLVTAKAFIEKLRSAGAQAIQT